MILSIGNINIYRNNIMKFVIERAILLKTLSHIQSIVEKRNTIPVLSNVRIEALGDGISFKATDMDTEITEIHTPPSTGRSQWEVPVACPFGSNALYEASSLQVCCQTLAV